MPSQSIRLPSHICLPSLLWRRWICGLLAEQWSSFETSDTESGQFQILEFYPLVPPTPRWKARNIRCPFFTIGILHLSLFLLALMQQYLRWHMALSFIVPLSMDWINVFCSNRNINGGQEKINSKWRVSWLFLWRGGWLMHEEANRPSHKLWRRFAVVQGVPYIRDTCFTLQVVNIPPDIKLQCVLQ